MYSAHTIIDLFTTAVGKYPKHSALVCKDAKNSWKKVSYLEYKRNVETAAKAFLKLGLGENETVAVLAHNCPEWMYSQLAANYCRSAVVGIYTKNTADAVFQVLQSTKAAICVVGDKEQLHKVKSAKSRLPHLKAVIQIEGPFETSGDGFYKWSDLGMITTILEEFNRRKARVSSSDCCSIVYTSNANGGAMVSHNGVLCNTRSLSATLPNKALGKEVFISYLPMNNIASQIFELFLPLTVGGTVYFADKDALNGSLLDTLIKVKPTRLYGVPKLWDMLMERIRHFESQSSIFALMLKKARSTVSEYKTALLKRKNPVRGPCYWLAKKVINNLKATLGLGQCRYFQTGGLSTAIDVKKYFLTLDVLIVDVYGMAETSGGVCFGDGSAGHLEAVKNVSEDVKLKIHNPNKRGEGEICIRGNCLFMGYLNDTSPFLNNGWWHTGDMGRIDSSGYLHISGRTKEVITTQSGQKIAPCHLEELVKNELPALSNAFLIEDSNKSLSILVTIKTEMNQATGAPLDQLHSDSIEWMKSMKLPYTKLSHILQFGLCSVVRQSIEDGIKRANLNATSPVQRIRRFTLLPHDFSVATDEIGNKTFYYES